MSVSLSCGGRKVCMTLQMCLFSLVVLCNNLCLFNLLVVLQLAKYNNISKTEHVLTEKTEWDPFEMLKCLYWPRELRENNMEIPSLRLHVPPFFRPLCWRRPLKRSCCSLYHSYDPHLRHRYWGFPPPSVSNSSSFIETNRLEVTPGRAGDDSWLLRSTQSEGFSFASKTWWYSFVAMAPNFLLAYSAKLEESLPGLLNGDVQPSFMTAVWCRSSWLPLAALF